MTDESISEMEREPCLSKTGRVTLPTGNKSAKLSSTAPATVAKEAPPILTAAPATMSFTPLPEAASSSLSPTSTTSPKTVTPPTSAPGASDATSPMTLNTMPELAAKPDLPNKDFSMEFSLTASYIQEYPYGDESLYKDCISEVMLKDGWSIRKEVRTEFGIADLVATRGMETWVMEAKISNDNNSIAHACGQLLFYTAAIPFTKRIVATPHKLPSFSLYKAMRINGIEPFEFTDYYFPAKCLFDKKSLLKRHNNTIESLMIAMQELMLFLGNESPTSDPETVRQWRALADMLAEAMTAVRQYSGESRPALSVIHGEVA